MCKRIYPVTPLILLFLIGGLPFSIPYQYLPTPVFPSEITSFILALLFIFYAILHTVRPLHFSISQIYWFLCALAVAIQLIWQTTLYYELKLIPIFFFLTASSMSWALTELKKQIDSSAMINSFLLGIVSGGAINTLIGFSQVYIGISTSTTLLVYGAIGQRNMYGNYLMSGFVSLIYLAYKYRLRWWICIFPITWWSLSLAWCGSRAVLLYIASLFIFSLWYLWRCPSLRRFCRMLILALSCAIIAQLLLPYINAGIGGLIGSGGNMPSALERLTANGARRLIEWKKAWQLFIDYPWLGVGWGSFPFHSIRLHAKYPEYFQVIESALFTHTHNSVLNILAEMGLIGSLLIIGGLITLVLSFCFRISKVETLTLAFILLIASLHSLVEYPLWYFHFFALFVILIGLLAIGNWPLWISGRFIKSLMAVYVILAVTCAIWGCFTYQYLAHWQTPHSKPDNNISRLKVLKMLQKNPLVDFHAALTASAYIDANHDATPEITLPLLTRLNRLRPYPWQLMDEVILQSRINNIAAAHILLKLAMYGYPDSLPYFEKSIQQSQHASVKPLLVDVKQAKRVFLK